MEFYIAQGISILTAIISMMLMHMKNMTKILIGQIIVNLLAASTYLLLGGGTGAIVSLIAIVQSIVMFVYNKLNKKPHLLVTLAFILAYTASSAINFKGVMDIFPALAAICFAISLIQVKTSVFRIWGAFNPSMWLPYDLYSRRESNAYALRRAIFASFAKSRLARSASCFNSL